jgi:hypothetical protein
MPPKDWNDEKENQFQTTMKTDPRYQQWAQSFLSRFGEFPNLNAPEYDYRAAVQGGVFPTPDQYDNNFPHWPSSMPDGTPLKSADHPTMWKEKFMQRFGVNPDQLINDQGADESRLRGLLD